MATSSRNQVLAVFKSLHRAAQTVFAGDDLALQAARLRISEDFRKNKHVKDSTSVAELMNFAKEVEIELQTSVVQAKEKQPGIYEARMTKSTMRLDNVPFNEAAILAKPNSRRGCKK